MRRLAQCAGAFASYLRSAERFGQSDPRDVLESKPQKRGKSALFPLPLPSAKGVGGSAEPRLPPNGRARSRALKRRAVRQLQTAMVHFLNFEASGRRREVTRTERPNASEAQKRALACLEDAARAMLCAEVQRCSIATLALGRGKIAAGRDAVAMIRRRVSEIALQDGSYRISAAVAQLHSVPDIDKGADVDMSRVKLPPPGLAATVPVAEFLSGAPELLAAYEHPSTLERHSGDALGLGTAGYAAPSPYRTAAGLGPASLAAPSPNNDAAGPGTAGLTAPSPDRTAAGLGPAGCAAPSPNLGAAGLGTAGKAAPSPGRTAAGLGPAGYAAPSPPVVRACSRLLPEELPRALEALDVSGMLAAVRRGRTSARCGLFCVRKEWCPQRRVWMLRLILDRRPRNAEERQVQAEEDTMPHGCVFCEIILEHDEEVRLWLSDLPQWYYRMKVSAERAATNVFTKVLDGDAYRGLAAVQALLASEGRAADDDAPVGPVQFALGTLAMGDVNATVFAQSAHVELLRRFGAMRESEMMVYRGLPPRGKTWEGVVIDDHAIAAVTRRGAPSATPATRRARELFSAGRAAYESIGIEDVAEKRQQGQLDAVAWGCEVQGRRGRAGSRRAKRAALAALTLDLVMIGCTTVELLQSIVGLWSDVLLYRREAFAVFSAVYHFLERYKDDSPRVVRALPGVVRNDLLGVVCLAPLLDYPLRSSVAPVLHVSDASLDGAAAVEADIPPLVARELWRRRIRAGTRAAALGTPGNRKGDSFVGEIVEGLPMRTRLQFIFRGAERKARNINAGEIRGRKALWRDIANNATEHRRRHLVVYDSASTVGASSKGRSPAIAMMKELRLTYPLILAADCAEGALWCESEMNAADHGSRGRKLAMPAPRRAWVHDFFTGDVDALDRRIRCSEPTGASTPDWRADHDAKEFDATLGYPGEGPAAPGPRAAGRNQRARASVDLRVRAQGAGSRPQDLERLRVRFGVWLAARGAP